MNKNLTLIEQEQSREFLKLLLQYIAENPDDWERICDMEAFGVSAKQRFEIMGRLEKSGLLPVAYVVLYLAGSKSREMEVIYNQIHNALAASVPVEDLMRIIREAFEVET